MVDGAGAAVCSTFAARRRLSGLGYRPASQLCADLALGRAAPSENESVRLPFPLWRSSGFAEPAPPVWEPSVVAVSERLLSPPVLRCRQFIRGGPRVSATAGRYPADMSVRRHD